MMTIMTTTTTTPTSTLVTTRSDRRVEPARRTTSSRKMTQRRGWIINAQGASNDGDRTVAASGGRRGLIFGAAIAAATMAMTSNAAHADGFGEAYVTDTLATLEAAQRIAKGASSDEASDRALVDGWSERNKKRYNAKTQGKSYLMTTKVVTLLKGKYAAPAVSTTLASTTFDADKFDEWTEYARGFTDGSLTGKAAREAYGSAVWGNYDKADPKNRIGLCVFGATPPTEALGINCSGF